MNKIEEIAAKKFSNYENINEVYLFGSLARNDHDKFSDIDILIIIDDCLEEEYIYYKNFFSNILDIPVNWISLYRKSKIHKMHCRGSYFLWHIKLEGVKIYSKNNDLERLLKFLPKYNNVIDDLDEYNIILNDVNEQVYKDYVCIDYELSVLASLARNVCIAIAYLYGYPDFGRYSTIKTCDKCIESRLPFSLEEYKQLYDYRLYYTGKLDKLDDYGTLEYLKNWINRIKQLIYIAYKKGSDYFE